MVPAKSPGKLTEAAMQPVTQYAKSGDVHVAYQVFGNGPINLIMVPGFVSNIENYWDQPDLARFLNQLGSYARVVTFDKRGTGMSDRVAELPGLDQRMDDLRAVMDAAGMEQAALLGVSEGAPLSVLFAATYPHRCRALVLYGSFPRFSYWFPTQQALDNFLAMSSNHGALAPAYKDSHPHAQMTRRFSAGGVATSGSGQVPPPSRLSCA
jgi:pimeloyl-ACP methyl ester carboxylesterase